MHDTHVFFEVRQTFPEVQSVSPRHCTQLPVVLRHTRLPVQSLVVMHETQMPASHIPGLPNFLSEMHLSFAVQMGSVCKSEPFIQPRFPSRVETYTYVMSRVTAFSDAITHTPPHVFSILPADTPRGALNNMMLCCWHTLPRSVEAMNDPVNGSMTTSGGSKVFVTTTVQPTKMATTTSKTSRKAFFSMPLPCCCEFIWFSPQQRESSSVRLSAHNLPKYL